MTTALAFTDRYGPGLDLNTPAGFVLTARGVTLEDLDVDRQWLSQPPHDGALPAGDHRPVRIMQISIRMTEQATAAAMKALQEALNLELDRPVNEISWTPAGWAEPELIDTYRAPLVSLFRGQDLVPTIQKRDLEPMELKIPIHPVMRGAGSFI
jgi:hypothetical protein